MSDKVAAQCILVFWALLIAGAGVLPWIVEGIPLVLSWGLVGPVGVTLLTFGVAAKLIWIAVHHVVVDEEKEEENG